MAGKKLIFVSNYFNHHQKALAEEFVRIYGDDYAFVAMTPFNQKRLAIGYSDMNQAPFVVRAYESPEAEREARMLIDESECVIMGGMPVSVISSRLKQGKITFLQSERFLKGPLWRDAARIAKYLKFSGGRAQARDKRAKFYLLCAGAFTAWDYGLCGLFRNKAYRWGYFTELKSYDIEYLISRKERGLILWAGRFLDWKHPDLAVRLAERLKASGKSFRLKIIGSGEMHDELTRMIDAKNLHECAELSGALPVEQMRSEMERAQIFLFTSDRGEGWGAVLSEAMNSGCVTVAGDRIGSAPYLINDGQNGVLFRDKDLTDLTRKVSALIDDPVRCCELGRSAYGTISGEWSPKTAAERFVELAERLRVSDEPVSLWEEGPGSLAHPNEAREGL